MLTKKQLYGYCIIKWHRVRDLLYQEDWHGALELAGSFCSFCYDAKLPTIRRLACKRCKINPDLCGQGGSAGLIYQISERHGKTQIPLVDEMIELLEHEYEHIDKPKVFKFPGENIDYYLDKL